MSASDLGSCWRKLSKSRLSQRSVFRSSRKARVDKVMWRTIKRAMLMRQRRLMVMKVKRPRKMTRRAYKTKIS